MARFRVAVWIADQRPTRQSDKQKEPEGGFRNTNGRMKTANEMIVNGDVADALKAAAESASKLPKPAREQFVRVLVSREEESGTEKANPFDLTTGADD